MRIGKLIGSKFSSRPTPFRCKGFASKIFEKFRVDPCFLAAPPATSPPSRAVGDRAIVARMSEFNYLRLKRPSRITVPEGAHPLAKLVFSQMAKQGVTGEELEWRAGVLVSTFKSWRHGTRPGLAAIQAALGALGWDLVPVRMAPLPAHISAGLAGLRDQWAAEEPQTLDLLAAAALAPVRTR